MKPTAPPTIAPVAAARWERTAPARPPWLHEEVARRMADRLQWIKLAPQAWLDWQPVRGGLEGHRLVAAQYPAAACHVVEPWPAHAEFARQALAPPWWRRLGGPRVLFEPPPPGGVQMAWANMQLHLSADPLPLLRNWHEALATGGFLMFSCLGPDTLRELRAVYGRRGWGPPGHEFTDMHDWGDLLIECGFTEPVMDMERLTLSYETPARLLEELAELGANLHPARFAGLRGRGWRLALEAALDEDLRGPDGRLALTFEVVYGHAMKPLPRAPVSEQSAVSLQDMRAMLGAGRPPRGR